MKTHRTYDFNAEARPPMPETVRELLIDGWGAYYRWQLRLRKKLALSQPDIAITQARNRFHRTDR